VPAETVKSQVKDTDCIAFLQWALPHLDLCWSGQGRQHSTLATRRKMLSLSASLGSVRIATEGGWMMTNTLEAAPTYGL
jgi:hypothetical protein